MTGREMVLMLGMWLCVALAFVAGVMFGRRLPDIDVEPPQQPVDLVHVRGVTGPDFDIPSTRNAWLYADRN